MQTNLATAQNKVATHRVDTTKRVRSTLRMGQNYFKEPDPNLDILK